MIKSLFFTMIYLFVMHSFSSAQQLGRTADRNNTTYSNFLKHELQLKWKVQTQGRVFSSPIVADGVLYVGSCDSNLYAINAANGDVLWRYKSGGEIRSSVAVDAGLVYALSMDGNLYALEAKTGGLKWKYKTDGEQVYDTWDYYLSSPAIDNGIVYFGSGDSHVYALYAHDGSLCWRFKTEGIVHAAPTLADAAIFIGSFDGYFYCLEMDGSLRWKFNTIGEYYFPKGEVQFHAVVSDNTVYFGARDFNLYALNIKDGSGHWMYHQQGSWVSIPSVYKDRLLVTMSDSFSALIVEKSIGKVLYEPTVPLNVFSSASLSGSSAYFGAIDGVLYHLSIEKGTVSPIFQTESSKIHRAEFFDTKGRVKQDLIAYYNNDVDQLFDAYHKMGSIFSTVWIDKDVLYFGSSDGAVYALH